MGNDILLVSFKWLCSVFFWSVNGMFICLLIFVFFMVFIEGCKLVVVFLSWWRFFLSVCFGFLSLLLVKK